MRQPFHRHLRLPRLTLFWLATALVLLSSMPSDSRSEEVPETWPLNVEGTLCRDAFAVSYNGEFVVFIQRADDQPPRRKGPPPPENGTIWVQALKTGAVTKLGGRDTRQAAYPYFCYPGPQGRYYAALVHRLANPLDPTSDNNVALYMIDLPQGSSRKVAENVRHIAWAPQTGNLRVSRVAEDLQTQAVREYDPREDRWTDLPFFGIDWGSLEMPDQRLVSVVPGAIDHSASLLTQAQPTLAAVTDSGQLMRDLAWLDPWSEPPVLSADGRYVGLNRLRLQGNGAPQESIAIAPLASMTNVQWEFVTEGTLIGVSNSGQAVMRVPSLDGSGDRIQRLDREGMSQVLAEGVEVATVVGNALYWVGLDRPAQLHRLPLSGETSTPQQPANSTDSGPNLLGQGVTTQQPQPEAPSSPQPEPGALEPTRPTTAAGERFAYSPQQEQIRERLGDPQAFTLQFLDEQAGPVRVTARAETWTYFAARTEFEFLDGECIAVRELPARDYPKSVVVYRPEQFVAGQSLTQLREALGIDDFEPIELELEAGLEPQSQKLQLWANGSLVLGFAQERLVLVQSQSRLLPRP